MSAQLAVPTRPMGSNRPPIVVNATTPLAYLDSGTVLLAANATKTFRVRRAVQEQPRSSADPVPVYQGTPPVLVGTAPAPAIAGGVTTVYRPAQCSGARIMNRSGQDAEITLIVGVDGVGRSEQSYFLPNGETWVVDGVRILSVSEKNIGAGTQTGQGVVYVFNTDPAIG